MAPAGYSGTPLAKKLGIKPGARVLLIDAPPGFATALAPLPADVEVKDSFRGSKPFDVVLLFAPNAAAMERRLDAAIARLTTAGGVWIAWPKKASGMETDLSDGAVRKRGLATGLVDNKVCAVDETWSGLRFVRRRKDR